MPIVKIPLQHKFGIVSLSRAETLLTQNRLKSSSRKSQKSSPGIDITQKFVTKYNDTAEGMRDALDATIQRTILHAKYKAGLLKRAPVSPTGSTSPHASLPVQSLFEDSEESDVSSAWLELTLLCQCYGQHQQDALLVLALSLNHAPLSSSHVSSLLYIAGLCYQWLKNDEMSGNLLRTGELLLLKILYFVSLRLHYHHLVGVLADTCTREEIRQLKFDLEGFENREKAYRNFPEALLHWKIALEMGILICENYSKAIPNPSPLSPISFLAESSLSDNDHEHKNNVNGTTNDKHKPSIHKSRSQSVTTTGTPAHNGSGLSPILWHTLDVWQCIRYGNESLGEAIDDLLNCSTDFNCDKWIQGALAMCLLCVASQMSVDILTFVQSLASGTAIPTRSNSVSAANKDSHGMSSSCSLKSLQRTDPSKSPAPSLSNVPSVSPSPKRETRFKLPSSPSRRESTNVRKVSTLNMLGMQPDFDDMCVESTFTLNTVVTNATSRESEPLTYSGTEHNQVESFYASVSPTTVGTQSLIESEIIPETLPSTHTSNSTMVDFDGSVTAIDDEITVDMSKSAAFFCSGNFKSLDISDVPGSNKTVSPLSAFRKGESTPGSNSTISPLSRRTKSPPASTSARTVDKQTPTMLKSPKTEPLDRVELLGVRFPTQHDQEEMLSLQKSRHDPTVGNTESHYTHSMAPLSDGAAVPGSQVAPSTVYRRSVFSTPDIDLESSSPHERSSQLGFKSWSNEIALLYTLGMTDAVIYGRTTLIQKTALQGCQRQSKERLVGSSQGTISSYGLVQLSEFSKDDPSDESKSQYNFLSWAVRHTAILGLSRVCKVCQQIPIKDGFSNVAWKKLMDQHSSEQEDRVLEAYKLSQACPDMDSTLLSVEAQPLSSPLLAHIADRLSQLFLPPVSLLADVLEPQKPRAKLKAAPMKTDNRSLSEALKKIQPRVCTKSTAKVPQAPSFNSRTMGALNKIAEEHWKRQMEDEKKAEEKAMKENEEILKKEYEEKMKRKQEKLAQRRPKQT